MAASSPKASSVIELSVSDQAVDLGKDIAEGDREALGRPAVLRFAQGLPDDGDDVGMKLCGEPGSLDVRGVAAPGRDPA